MSRESGALYVRIGDTMHPVPNLASARLVAGTAANPEMVSEAAINTAKRGPLGGHPGRSIRDRQPVERTTNRVGRSAIPADRRTRIDDDRDRRGRGPIGLIRSGAFSSHRGRRARRRRTCCMTGGGPEWTCATPPWCGHCGSTASRRGRFRVRCSMRYPKPRRSLLRTFRAPARPDRRLSPDSPSAPWCGSPVPTPRSITWCSPTACSGSAKSPRTSFG